ncbi:MAG: hypothetical protein IK093_05705 [Ruminiclostridium sp.]|nr:hypothetical protein [Ruminiclostridium sp.]
MEKQIDKSNIFRKQSLERVKSPEQLNDYLHVTSPAIWVVLVTVLLLIGVLFAWSAFTAYESSATGIGTVSGGTMTVVFDNENTASNVQTGMNVTVGDVTGVISSVGIGTDGRLAAVAQINMPDGVYEAKVTYKQTQVISLLLG